MTVKPIDIIKKFSVAGGEGISEYWRTNKSPIETKELANLLYSIRKITSYIGPHVGNVIWNGMRSTAEATDIAINPQLVMGRYPIPGNKTDIVIGTVISEALKKAEWSQRVIDQTFIKYAKVQVEANYRLKMFLDIAEQIYVDIVSNRSILGLYTEKVRQTKFNETKKYFVQPPSFGELINIWWLMAGDRSGCKYQEDFTHEVYNVRGYNLEYYYLRPLRLLNSIIKELIEECPKIRSVVDRCNYRVTLYVRVWKELIDMTRFWMVDAYDPILMPKAIDINELVSKESGDALKAIQATLAREVEASLTQNVFDLTDDIRIICGEDADIVPIKVTDYVIPLIEPLDRELMYRLYVALKSHAKKRNIFTRGLKNGKLDSRRLFRAPINGNIFHYKKQKLEMNSHVVLLVDATGSMGGPKWKQVQRIYNALYEAVNSFNKTTRVFAYSEVRGECIITELTPLHRVLNTVKPQGKTASGEAIIATALMLKKSVKRPFIIHLTDGASNWGADVKHAINFCKEKKINLMSLGFRCSPSNKTALKKEYEKQVVFIDSIKELPKEFAKLLANTNYL
ncbi:MAG: VWA domain-containing protein [Clostridia bacterium]|nr:VWA domain-containing protein [Clostridia bacterium]